MDCVSIEKNNESEISQSKSAHTNPKHPSPRIRIIFEFSVTKPTPVCYRAVQAADGGFRMEKRGLAAKKFKAFMWTGSEEGLYKQIEVAEWCYGKQNVSAIRYPATA